MSTTLCAFVSVFHTHAQECGTPPPTTAALAAEDALYAAGAGSQTTNGAITWNIPVKVTICRRDDGTHDYSIPPSDALVDAFLSKMNAQISGGPATFNYYRCGPISYIDVTALYLSPQGPSQYSYARNVVNLYIYLGAANPSAGFPWFDYPLNNVVRLSSGTGSLDSPVAIHEMGHNLGLLHTFSPEVAYIYPVQPGQQDHPYNQSGARELVIRTSSNTSKPFPDENSKRGGDRVEDTPAGCADGADYAAFYPSPETLAGCMDGTLTTPCINGCTFDLNNCRYIGNYRDYNLDPIDDPNNILVRNYMSYTGNCRIEFTQGQKVRANDMMNIYLGDYYQNNVCNSLNDRVEINGTAIGLSRVAVKVIPTDDVYDESRSVTNATGDFYGKLRNTFAIPVRADVVKFGDKDLLNYTPEEWLKGVTTRDLALISNHILGISQLNGYGQLAADANKSGSITLFDVTELRKLIIGIYDKLPNYSQPWRFVPEIVTTFDNGVLNSNFDGGGDDNPFNMEVLGQTVIGAPYAEPNWPYIMRRNRPNNGFDAVKIGDVDASYTVAGQAGTECEESLPVLVPPVALNQGETVALQVKGYQLQDVVGFQLGFAASGEDFEYLGTTSNNLDGFTEADAVGGLRLGKDNLKILWLSENNTAKTFNNGNVVLSFQLKAKRPIANLSQALKADNTVLPNLFVGTAGNCKSGGSLELALTPSAEGREGVNVLPKRIFCLPNPAQEEATLLYDATDATDARIFFHDIQGRLLDIMDYPLVQGRNVIRLQNLDRLPKGVINISVNDKTGVQSVRMLKQ